MTAKLLTIVALLLVPAIALAGADPAAILAADGFVANYVQYAPSPVPAYCEWNAPDAAVSYHATEADGGGTLGCIYPWSAHAGADSLSFNGSFPQISAQYLFGAHYGANLSCRVRFSEETVVVADRWQAGEVSGEILEAWVVRANGDEIPLLSADGPHDQGRAFLKAGEYEIHVRVSVWQLAQGSGQVPGYSGRVCVTWSENVTVETEASSWGKVKSLYR